VKLSVDTYLAIRAGVVQAGFQHDIDWSQSVGTPETPEILAQEAIFVICNSGMRHTVAQQIYRRVMHALIVGVDPREVFRHPGKSQAIAGIWKRRSELLVEFLAADDKVAWCGELPWVGKITQWHLAKNLGVDCAKPDRWLVRLAAVSGETVDALCRRLHDASGDRVATVDYVLWRACAVGLVVIAGDQVLLRSQDIGRDVA